MKRATRRNKLYRLSVSLIITTTLFLLAGCTPSSNVINLTIFQEGNKLAKTKLLPKQSKELLDNRIGAIASDMLMMPNGSFPQIGGLTSFGLKRYKWSVNEVDATLNPDGTIPQINYRWSQRIRNRLG
jgi:hypothetical protein